MVRLILGKYLPSISVIGAGVHVRVAVDHFAPAPAERHADFITLTRHRGEVGHHQHWPAVLAPAQPGVDAVDRIVTDQPLEALGRVVLLMQGGFLAVQAVKVADQPLHAFVLSILQQVPIQLLVVVPLAPLAEFAAHEQQFFAGVHPHERQIGTQVGKLLPAVARHLVDQRMLAVHHLIVGDR